MLWFLQFHTDKLILEIARTSFSPYVFCLDQNFSTLRNHIREYFKQ